MFAPGVKQPLSGALVGFSKSISNEFIEFEILDESLFGLDLLEPELNDFGGRQLNTLAKFPYTSLSTVTAALLEALDKIA